MDSIWLLYWITRLDAIGSVFEATAAVCCMGLIVNLALGTPLMQEGSISKKLYKTIFCSLGALLVISVMGKTLTPSKEDALMIAGGVVLTEIVQSEAAGRIASKSVLVVENWLDRNIPKEEKK